MKRAICAVATFGMLAAAANTPPVITNVRASQRTGTKLVDIYYNVSDADGDLLKVRVEISDNDGARYSVPAFTLTGDIGEGISPGTNKHIVWDAGTDWDGEYTDKMRVKVFAIDAKGFPGMEWGNEVPPGGFLMGQDGGAEGNGPSRHVSIPWSYWLTKYEITCRQYCDYLNAAHIAGHLRQEEASEVYATDGMPIDSGCVPGALLCRLGDNYNIRWNVNNFEPVAGKENYPACATWYGAMAFCRFYGYDLPTEAEWEKAARGPDYDDQDEHCCYPWGNSITTGYANNSNSNYSDEYPSTLFKPVGYYNGNQTPIGPNTINQYGLYDMIGNAVEWTRSREGSLASYPNKEDLKAECNNPFLSGNMVLRGDYKMIFERIFNSKELWCYYYSSGSNWEDTRGPFYGFRAVRRVSGVDDIKVSLIASQNFSSFPLTTGGYSTGSTSGWRYEYCKFSDVGVNGSRVQVGTNWSDTKLYLPASGKQVCGIKFKARNSSLSSSNYSNIDFYGVKNGIRTSCSSIRVYGGNTDFQTMWINVPETGCEEYYIQTWYSELTVDDIEVYGY